MKNFIKMAFSSGLKRLGELRYDSFSKEWMQSLNASIPKLNEMLMYYESIGDTASYDKIYILLNDISSKINTAQESVGVSRYNRYDNFLFTENGRVLCTEGEHLILI